MPNYSPRQAGKANFAAGVILLLVAAAAIASISTSGMSGSNLLFPVLTVFLFVFMGGYEIGKYSENRIAQQRKHGDKSAQNKPSGL